MSSERYTRDLNPGAPTILDGSSPLGGTRRFLVLTFAVGVGILLAHFCMPTLFRALPTDMSRTAVILDALDESPLHPEVCVLGNSIVMNGVDTRQLSEALPGRPEAWNLSSSGQSLFESFLLYQELPESVMQVVQW